MFWNHVFEIKIKRLWSRVTWKPSRLVTFPFLVPTWWPSNHMWKPTWSCRSVTNHSTSRYVSASLIHSAPLQRVIVGVLRAASFNCLWTNFGLRLGTSRSSNTAPAAVSSIPSTFCGYSMYNLLHRGADRLAFYVEYASRCPKKHGSTMIMMNVIIFSTDHKVHYRIEWKAAWCQYGYWINVEKEKPWFLPTIQEFVREMKIRGKCRSEFIFWGRRKGYVWIEKQGEFVTFMSFVEVRERIGREDRKPRKNKNKNTDAK